MKTLRPFLRAVAHRALLTGVSASYVYFDGTIGDFLERSKNFSLFGARVKLNDLKDNKKLFTVFAPVNYGIADLANGVNFDLNNHVYDRLIMPSADQKTINVNSGVALNAENNPWVVECQLRSPVVPKAIIANNGIIYALDLPIVTARSVGMLLTKDGVGMNPNPIIMVAEGEGNTVLKTLERKVGYDVFYGLLQRAGFISTLERRHSYTLFALDNDVVQWVAGQLGFETNLSDMGLEELKFFLMHFVVFDTKLSPRNANPSNGYTNNGKTITLATSFSAWSNDNMTVRSPDGFTFDTKTYYQIRDLALFDRTPVNGSIIYVTGVSGRNFIQPLLAQFPERGGYITVLDFSKISLNNPVIKELETLDEEVVKTEKTPVVNPSKSIGVFEAWGNAADEFKSEKQKDPNEVFSDDGWD